MPYSIAIAAATTAGSPPVAQAITVNCQGHTPKAVIVMVTRATSLATLTMGAMDSVGFSDGTTTRVATAMSEDATISTSADTGSSYNNAKIIRVLATTSEATDGEADLSSLAADTVNLSWTDLPSAAHQIIVLAFWGQRLTAKAFSQACSTTQDTSVSVTGLAVAPTAAIFVNARANFLGVGANATMNLGFAAFNADLSVQGQAAYGLREGDRPALTTCFSAIRDDCVSFRTTTTAEEARYEVTTATADGFTVFTRVASGFSHTVGGIAITVEGGRANCDVVDIGTNSTGDKTVSGLSGRPGLVMMIGTALGTVNSYASAAPCGNWSFGAAIPPYPSHALQNACIGYAATDNAVTSATQCTTDDTKLAMVPADTSGLDWGGHLVSVAAGQFVFNVGSQSSAARLLAYLVLEEPSDNAWLAEARSGSRWRRQLARM